MSSLQTFFNLSQFGCHIDATEQQRALNFELVVSDQFSSIIFIHLNTTNSKFSALCCSSVSMWHPNRRAQITDKRTDVWSQDFIIWKTNSGQWAVVWAGLWNKRVWANYKQLLRPVFSLFRGQKKILKFFWKHSSNHTKKIHNTFFTKHFSFNFLNPKKRKKTGVF